MCKKQHIKELCENSIFDIKTCNLGHPKECRYFRDYRRCKFGEWCCFLHVHKDDDIEKLILENEAMLKKIS